MVGLTIGTFDFCHRGHQEFLYRAGRLVDKLIVGVNTDEFVEQYKGVKPHYSLEERIRRVEEEVFCAGVCISYGSGAQLIQTIQPDLFIVGSDWRDKNIYTQLKVPNTQLRVVYVPYTEGISSTKLRNELNEE